MPKSETEKALKDSLRDMEMQCKERVDLLEALKASRQEAAGEGTTGDSNGKLKKTSSSTLRQSSDSGDNERGFIGGGTIPAVNYPDLTKPAPPLPKRPALISKTSSEQAVVGRNISSSSLVSPPSSRMGPQPPTVNLVPPMKKTSRSPSPDKGRHMLQTLRSSDRKGSSSRPSRPSGARRAENPVTNKAATLAWQNLGKGGSGRDRLGRSLDPEADNSTTTLSEGERKSSASGPSVRPGSANNIRYEKTTRRLVNDDEQSPVASPTDLLATRNDLYRDSGRSNAYPFPPTDPGQPGAVSGSMLTTSTLQDLLDLIEQPTPTGTEQHPPRPRKSPPPPPPHSRPPAKLEPLSYPTYLREYPETSAKQAKAKADSDLPVRRKPADSDRRMVKTLDPRVGSQERLFRRIAPRLDSNVVLQRTPPGGRHHRRNQKMKIHPPRV